MVNLIKLSEMLINFDNVAYIELWHREDGFPLGSKIFFKPAYHPDYGITFPYRSVYETPDKIMKILKRKVKNEKRN